MLRLYFDEDAQRGELVQAIRLRGVDVLTNNEADFNGRSDVENLVFATEQNRVIYSFNVRDFARLHSAFITEERTHAGIILAAQQRYAVGEQVRRLLRITNTLTAEQMQDSIEYLSAWG